MHPSRAVAVLVGLTLLGCAAKPGPTESEDASVSVPVRALPPNSSAYGIRDFLLEDPRPYREGWTAQTAAPRPSGGVSPHASVRVFYNPVLAASFAKGNGDLED